MQPALEHFADARMQLGAPARQKVLVRHFLEENVTKTIALLWRERRDQAARHEHVERARQRSRVCRDFAEQLLVEQRTDHRRFEHHLPRGGRQPIDACEQ